MSEKEYNDMFKAVVDSSIVDFEDAFSKALSNKVSERIRDKELSVSSSLMQDNNTEQGDDDDPKNDG
jgi:hypothetical protein